MTRPAADDDGHLARPGTVGTNDASGNSGDMPSVGVQEAGQLLGGLLLDAQQHQEGADLFGGTFAGKQRVEKPLNDAVYDPEADRPIVNQPSAVPAE